MKYTKSILATAAVVAILAAAPLRAEDTTAQKPGMIDNAKTGFALAIQDIQNWFGDDTPDAIEPASGNPDAIDTTDDYMQVPTPVDPSLVEPAAGMDEDVLQVPPQYTGPVSDATGTTGTPRATAFDNNQSATAFGDNIETPEQLSGIVPAAGDITPENITNADCTAVLDAAKNAPESEDIDATLVEACEVKSTEATPAGSDTEVSVESELPAEPTLAPAQPAFETTPMQVAPQALPETQPAGGEPVTTPTTAQ